MQPGCRTRQDGEPSSPAEWAPHHGGAIVNGGATPRWTRHLLTIDALAGATVGTATAATAGRLVRWYGLPARTLRAITAANLGYALGATSLAVRPDRTRTAVRRLAVANVMWGAVCLALAWRHRRTATRLGIAQLISEAAFVGGLGLVELRNLDHLSTTQR